MSIPRIVTALVAVLLLARGAAAADPVPFSVKRNLEYAKAGDVSLTLDAYLPRANQAAKLRPAVLVVHGGA